jgi:hypothetical protein
MPRSMYQATNSLKRSFVRASRPISVPVGTSADALLVEAFSAVALALACFLIALNDAFDPFRGRLVILRVLRLAILPAAKK